MAKTLPVLGVLDKLFIGLLLTIFAVIVVHAPLTVWFGTIFPEADLFIKAWKELLMVPAAVLALVLLRKYGRWDILRSPWMLLIGVYTLLHILLIPIFFTGLEATVAGLMIDLRYIAFFALVLIAIQLYPQLRRIFLYVFLGGALLVGTFALAQVLILPPDFLSVLGYGPGTIQPFLTIDENPDYVRISSTLRGPNPLGAYAVIVLALASAYFWRVRRSLKPSAAVLTGLVLIGSAVALWFSYSRSALVAAVVAVGLVFLLTLGRKLPRWVWISMVVVALAFGGALIAARDTPFVQNVILHQNEGTGGVVSSNEGHLESLIDGTERKVNQPFGAGIGSTGSASLFTEEPLIIENQYLFIAHEVGWLGVVLFLLLFVRILLYTYKHRRDWLALGVFASGVGLALIGILLPVWVDDTVSIIWWGLAAIAIGGYLKKGAGNGRTINASTKRTP